LQQELRLGGYHASNGCPESASHATKREEYLAYGLLEYWIVDPLERKGTVLTRRGDAWNEVVFRDDQVIGSLVLPGFATTVAELWNDLEEDDDQNDPGANDA
jgi:Uma2 family endonuclease